MHRQILMVAAALAAIAAAPCFSAWAEERSHGGGAFISAGSRSGGGGSFGGGSFARPSGVGSYGGESHSYSHSFSGGRLPSGEGYRPGRSFSAPSEERELARPRSSIPSFGGGAVRPPLSETPVRPPGNFIPFSHEAPAPPGPAARPGEPFSRAPIPSARTDEFRSPLTGGPSVNEASFPSIARYLQTRGRTVDAFNASRQQALSNAHGRNAPRLEQFAANRTAAWDQLKAERQNRVQLARQGGAAFQNYRQAVWSYRYNRADQIRDRIGGHYDGLFTTDWWRRQRWWRDRGYGFAGIYDPWWWWYPCGWADLDGFLDADWSEPVFYDYGANVIEDNGQVYVDGEDRGTAAEYAQEAAPYANPPDAPETAEAPAPPGAPDEPPQWKPFGVFALTQEQSGDAIMFFQLSVSRSGLIGGAYTNVLSGDTEPVTGSIDRARQKAVWHVGEKTTTIFETGVYNLTQDTSPVLIHFDGQDSQTWLLVRLPAPDLPTAPTPLNGSP